METGRVPASDDQALSAAAPRPVTGLRLRQRHIGDIRRVMHEGDFYSSPCFEIVVDGSPLRYVESNRLAYKRVEGLFSKEPTTIPWLEAIQPGETLVDVGANVGTYSIYAAIVSRCRVFAFEPEALNYAELNKNIFVNGLHDRVTAFCLALSDEAKVGYLHLGAFGMAYSHHDFEESTWTEDKVFGDKTTRRDARLRQGSVSTTLDWLVQHDVIPRPDHIKIDVDGLEHRVIAGCWRTLHDPLVKTCLVEIDFRIDRDTAIVDAMVEAGWKYSPEQLRTNRKMILSDIQVEQTRRNKRGGFNYIFFRDDRYHAIFADYLAGYRPYLARNP
jgi:FkbM family methyltransferase